MKKPRDIFRIHTRLASNLWDVEEAISRAEEALSRCIASRDLDMEDAISVWEDVREAMLKLEKIAMLASNGDAGSIEGLCEILMKGKKSSRKG